MKAGIYADPRPMKAGIYADPRSILSKHSCHAMTLPDDAVAMVFSYRYSDDGIGKSEKNQNAYNQIVSCDV
jgi:hypothetical protein